MSCARRRRCTRRRFSSVYGSRGAKLEPVQDDAMFNYDTECGSNHGTYRVRHSLLELSWMCLVFWPSRFRAVRAPSNLGQWWVWDAMDPGAACAVGVPGRRLPRFHCWQGPGSFIGPFGLWLALRHLGDWRFSAKSRSALKGFRSEHPLLQYQASLRISVRPQT